MDFFFLVVFMEDNSMAKLVTYRFYYFVKLDVNMVSVALDELIEIKGYIIFIIL
jgi:hypothetical protein